MRHTATPRATQVLILVLKCDDKIEMVRASVCHIWISHMDESCHIWMSHMDESCRIWMSPG